MEVGDCIQTPVIYEVICKTPDPEEPTAPDKPEDDDIINNLENVSGLTVSTIKLNHSMRTKTIA